MDWTQTLTIILTIGASTAAVWYVVKEDIKLVREGVKTEISLIREGIKTEISLIREDIKRHDEQFSKMNEEFSKRDTLWASLLEKMYNIEKQIYEIKLDQSKKA